MKKYLLTAFLLTALCVSSFAQGLAGTIKGTLVSRGDRSPIEGALVTIYVEGQNLWSTKTDASGQFRIVNVENGSYMLSFEADGYASAMSSVIVEGYDRDLRFISLSPLQAIDDVDGDNFAEFDLDDSGYNDSPTILFSSNDPYNSIAGYGFSAIRFKNRGYNSDAQDVYLSGIQLNDAITGYSPFSLWTGLNEAMRSKDSSNGLETADFGIGGVNGTTYILANPASVRKGWRFSILSNSATYRLRLMATYASGRLDNGWSYAVNVSARLGGNDWVKGVYYRSFAYYAGAEKEFGDGHNIALFTFAAPGQRGAQNASTQEVYDLMGDNYYNSNWGYQNGKVRNARVRKTFEPVTVLKYTWTPSENFESATTLLWRTGKNGYTALDWYDAQDPRPDYYRNLPSYAAFSEDEESAYSELKSDWMREAWKSNSAYTDYQHINWDRLYNVNYNSADGRSKYAQEERRVDQNEIDIAETVKWYPAEWLKVNAGASYKWNRSENYKIIADLLGGEYFLNVDSFAERDYAADQVKLQNDLDYYLEHGEAQKIYKGDKYGYDYLAQIRKANLWAAATAENDGLSTSLAAQIGNERFWREGLVRKGLFPDDSKGKSKESSFFTYRLKGQLAYVVRGGHRISANVGYMNDAPTFNQAFISPRTRNTLMDGLTTRKTFSADLGYQYSSNGYNLRLTGFYTTIKDQSDLMSFYDDTQNSFTNFAMTGIDERHVGLEFGGRMPLPVEGLSLGAALSYGEYIYTSTPHMVQTIDNSAAIIRDDDVTYWMQSPRYKRVDGQVDYDFNDNPIIEGYDKHYVPSTPQLASEIALNYRSKNYLFVELNAQYFAKSYLDMNPLYRTTYACKGSDADPGIIEEMTAQEEFTPGLVMNASIGKSWYIKRLYNIGFSLEVHNFLNNTGVKTGGYEQTRLRASSDKSRYYRFDSKYFYMPGANYMLNIYFRF